MKFCSRNAVGVYIFSSEGQLQSTSATSVEKGKRAVARATLAPSCARPCYCRMHPATARGQRGSLVTTAGQCPATARGQKGSLVTTARQCPAIASGQDAVV